MDNNKKAALAVVGLLGVAGLAALIGKRKREEEPPVTGATISIEVLDSEGNRVPHNSPYAFTEGGSYQIRVTSKNTSYRVSPSYPAAARLTTSLVVGTNITTFISDAIPYNFGAGEARVFSWNLVVPMGTAGQAGGVIAAGVGDPNGIQLASVGDTMTIGQADIVYGATIVFS